MCSPRENAGRSLSFADLVVIAKEFYPIPFRTRPSKPSASMVLRLKPRESRTLPGLPRAEINPLCASAHGERTRQHNSESPGHESDRGFCLRGQLTRPRVALGRAARVHTLSLWTVRPGKRSTGPFADPASPRQHNSKEPRRRNSAGLFAFQPSIKADRSAANSFSSMKSGNRYCGKLRDILSLRSTCRQSPSVSAK